jgi:hypothetical protein
MARTKKAVGLQKDRSFKFWKDNRLDKEFELTQEELCEKFDYWLHIQMDNLETRGFQWYEYYYSTLIRIFITDKEDVGGLQSVFEEDDYEALFMLLADRR